MSWVDSVDKGAGVLVKVGTFIAGFATFAMVINVFIDVVSRTLFNTPIQETTPLVTYWWMIPIVFLGIVAAQYHDDHTDLPMVFERLTDRGQALTSVVSLIATGIFVALVGWFGLQDALAQAAVGEYDSSTGLTTWPPQFFLPLACALMLLVILAQTLRNGLAFLQPAPTTAPVEDVNNHVDTH